MALQMEEDQRPASEHTDGERQCADLPEDVWLHIALNVELATAVMHLPRVCRQFREVTRKPSGLWRSLDLDRFRLHSLRRAMPYSPLNFRRLLGEDSMPLTEEQRAEEQRADAAFQHTTSCAAALCEWVSARGAAVEELTMGGFNREAARMLLSGLLGGALPNLTSLTFAESTEHSSHRDCLEAHDKSRLGEALGSCGSLQHLSLSLHYSGSLGCTGHRAPPQLTSLELDCRWSGHFPDLDPAPNPDPDPDWPDYWAHLPHLRSLKLRRFCEGVCLAAYAWKGALQDLELEQCGLPAKEGVAALQGLSALSRLTLERCTRVESLPLSGLRELVYHYSGEELERGGPGALPQAMLASAGCLQLLRVTGVAGLPAEVSVLTNLRELDIRFQGNADIPAGLGACTSLTSLTLGGRGEAADGKDAVTVCCVKQLDPRGLLRLQTLAFVSCQLRCSGLLAHAARLPALQQLVFRQASGFTAESEAVISELARALQGLGRGGVFVSEPDVVHAQAHES